MSQASKILIDGVDIYTYYGIFSVRGSLNDLTRLPDMKPVSTYNWADENGDDFYLNNRKIEARDIILTFLLSANDISTMWANRDAFFAALSADGIRDLEVTALGRKFAVYYVACLDSKFINAGKKRLELKLKFRLDVSESESEAI